MLVVYGYPCFRIEHYPLPGGDHVFSFFAEAEIDTKLASKEALCSIIASKKYENEINDLLELQTKSRELRFKYHGKSIPYRYGEDDFDMEYDVSYPEEAESEIDFSSNLKLNIFLQKMEESDSDSKKIEEVCSKLKDMGAENPIHLLGRTRLMMVDSDPSIFNNSIFISAIPIYGLITPIHRSEQFTLFNGKLVILPKNNNIRTHAMDYDNMYCQNISYDRESIDPKESSDVYLRPLKMVYLCAEVYDELEIHEYLVLKAKEADRPDYCVKHHRISVSNYVIDLRMITTNSEVIAKNSKLQQLFSSDRSVNLFPCGNLPKGIKRKNNELVTKL